MDDLIVRDVVDLLHALVSIDSVNPLLAPGHPGEVAIAQFITSWARDNGLHTQRIDTSTRRPSVLISNSSVSTGPTLLLCGHIDTVGVEGVKDPFEPRLSGDRLYGRGSYDMKAGLAAALIACRESARAGVTGRVLVAAVCDEESASTGIQEVLRTVTADAAIVTEPTELAVAVAHKGFVWTEITVTGTAAHGSRPHLGVDAILKTGPLLVAVGDLNERLQQRVDPVLGSANVHASLISGGIGESTIPDRCELLIERRTLPGETLEDVEAEVAQLLKRCREADEELDVRSRTTLARNPFAAESGAPIVDMTCAAHEAVTGSRPEISGVSFWADSAFIADAGIPTVLYGPGGEGAHAEVEWVSLSETVTCTRTLIATCQTFCS